tara:strand:+ start:53 stop:166 length:114 start_codon:yes stop_codon:yes gene_type:complete
MGYIGTRFLTLKHPPLKAISRCPSLSREPMATAQGPF